MKKGYKNTEIGVIPEDWKLISYDKAFNFLSTATYSRSDLTTDDLIMYVHYGDIHTKFKHFINFKEVRLPTISEEKSKRYSIIKDGDIIMADASEDYEGVGKSVEVRNIRNLKVISGLHTFLFRDKNNYFEDGFKAYISENSLVKKSFQRLATGMKVYGVSKTNLKTILIPLPTLQEQKAIAKVLSDTDALIANLKQLIAKKKAIKQGAMQELLTGKKRLKGFTGDWEVKILGKLGNTITGLSGKTKTDFENGIYPYITFLNVMNNVKIDTSIFGYVNIKKGETQNKFLKGDLFFNTSSETPEEVGMCAVLLDDIDNLYLNSFCFGYRLVDNLETDAMFLSYLINSSIGRKLFETLAQGATRYNLSKSNFNKIKILIPKHKEQQAIAQILSDMDTEIEALENQLQKTQDLKQGLMQELLTGKIRLVKNVKKEETKVNIAAESPADYGA